ncbi:hypothetical protein OE88DRAFT_1656209 [Heliocybe sulcata]|uniref:Sensor domain-containing protein n=1 Tax=Heliocybe sulcata TaxID=5364 RepID=A0A5C3NCX7_9AGAM|nr:hypothetical protein OE88DRAFT_1656209 [Heliocybe sulcata]
MTTMQDAAPDLGPLLGNAVDAHDPPPPYPSHRPRRTRQRRSLASGSEHVGFPTATTGEGQDNYEILDTLAVNINETVPLLSPDSPSSPRSLRLSRNPNPNITPVPVNPPPFPRPRTTSYTSTYLSTASSGTHPTRPPSLAHTVFSMFQSDDEMDLDENDRDYAPLPTHPPREGSEESSAPSAAWNRRSRSWRMYWRPLARRRYWMSLAHLLVVNFPFALAVWVYLFVFTLTGTTLLMALPLGAVLCFLNLLGARAFSRAELFLQSYFHDPLPYPLPYPPLPIFSRFRESTDEDEESRLFGSGHRAPLVYERSFYKNTYAMFTDPTSYRALFYFLVIKPSITLLFTLLFLVLTPLSFALIIPAPMLLRMARRLGLWQAGVAVEGLSLDIS